MADQRTIAENLLSEIPEAKGYHVVEPIPGDKTDYTKIQKNAPKARDVVTVNIPLSDKNFRDWGDYPTERLKNIIKEAIKQAEKGQ